MTMPGRSYTSESYRFGFQGQEKNNDISGVDGGHLDFKYRIHDARLGRFLSIDPLVAKYPWNSPYAFAENRVIDGIELEGLEYLDVDKQNVDGVLIQMQVTSYYKPTPNPEVRTTDYANTINGAGNVANSNQTNQTVVGGFDQRTAATIQFTRNQTGGSPAATQFDNPEYEPPIDPTGAGGPEIRQLGEVTTINLTGQFNQAFGVVNQTNPANPPANVNNTTNLIMGEAQNPAITTVMPNNVSRILIVTDGNVNSVNTATNVANQIQANNPTIQVSVISDPTRANPRWTVMFNPTQNVVNANWAGAAVNVPFVTPMINQAPNIPIVGAQSTPAPTVN
ncbi:MAG: hypothetical protein KDE33_09160 [Bacteroidetes bacterium]|nr:hypothetical protein [Bacteroidota bacterium]MCB9227523.1 hypothetical protein [Chitinophagales bacterium]